MFRNHMWNAVMQPPRMPPMAAKTQNPNPMPPAAGFMPGKYTNMAYQMAGFPQGMVMRDPTTPASVPPGAGMPPQGMPIGDDMIRPPTDILRDLGSVLNVTPGRGGGGFPRFSGPVNVRRV